MSFLQNPPPSNSIVEIEIERLGIHGEGVGYLEGYTLFVHGALPEERVKVQITERHKSFGRGSLLQILRLSPMRVEPRCLHFGECGGCQLMHLEYGASLEAKRQRVIDAFERIGNLKGIQVAPCAPSPSPFGYRNKIQLPLTEDYKCGLYALDSHRIVPIQTCYIHNPLGEKIFQAIKKELEHLPSSAHGYLKYLLIKTALATEEVLVTFVTKRKAPPWLKTLCLALVKDHPVIQGILENIHPQVTNTILGKHFLTLAGKSYITDLLCGKKFCISASSFFQVNPQQAAHLYQRALSLASLSGKETVIDAYCGVGTLSLLFAPHVKKVIGIESIPESIMQAKENGALNAITNVDFLCGLAETLLPQETLLTTPDLVILNPPRKGCAKELLETLRSYPPRQLLYISCNPATLARDVALLIEYGYDMKAAEPFDMFPQTAHVECLVHLQKTK